MSMEFAEGGHLEDEDLVRLMDGEGSEEEQAMASAHLLSCESCRSRRDALEATAIWLRTNLPLLDSASSDDEVGRARALARMRAARSAAANSGGGDESADRGDDGRGGWAPRSGLGRRLVAAGIGILLLVGLGVEPVRAWIRDGLNELSGRSDSVAEVVVPEQVPSSQSGASVRFAAAGPLFRVDMAEPQEEGSLTIRVIPGGEVSAEIVGGDGETLVILPSGLQVGNRAGSKANYVVALPAGAAGAVREVEIRVAGSVIDRRALSTVTEELTLTLAPGDSSP